MSTVATREIGSTSTIETSNNTETDANKQRVAYLMADLGFTKEQAQEQVLRNMDKRTASLQEKVRIRKASFSF